MPAKETRVPTILLHAADDREAVREDILPIFEQHPIKPVTFDMAALPEVEGGTTVACFLSDQNLRLLLPEAAKREWRIGLLPHPDMKSARQGFGIASKPAEAAEDILEARLGVARP
jgi:hypothetical protein